MFCYNFVIFFSILVLYVIIHTHAIFYSNDTIGNTDLCMAKEHTEYALHFRSDNYGDQYGINKSTS